MPQYMVSKNLCVCLLQTLTPIISGILRNVAHSWLQAYNLTKNLTEPNLTKSNLT